MRGGHNKPADLEVGTETSRLRGGHKNQQTRVESVSTFGRYVKVFFLSNIAYNLRLVRFSITFDFKPRTL